MTTIGKVNSRYPQRRLLIQFARWPVSGRVKTRLARTLGDACALSTHLMLVERTFATLNAYAGVALEMHWAGRPSHLAEWPGGLPAVADSSISRAQSGRDLGERMTVALQEGCRYHDRVALVGSDCPMISSEVLDQVFQALESHDAALVPAEDGGFVLIACRSECLGTIDLNGLSWGHSGVLEATRKRLLASGLRVFLLDPLWDVDEPEDLERFERLVNKKAGF